MKTALATTTTSDPISAFLAAMADAGAPYDDKDPIIGDGTIRRFQVGGDRKKRDSGWYVMFSDAPVSGAFGAFHVGVHQTWTAKPEKSLTKAERAILAQRNEDIRKKREALTRAQHEAARKEAIRIWGDATDCTGHPYLSKKQVKAHDLRVTIVKYDLPSPTGKTLTIAPGALVIPLRGTDGAIWSLQFITLDRKWYLPGGKKNGHFHLIGEKPKAGGKVLIVEGYSTGASCLDAIPGSTVVCALDAGNLEATAKAIQNAYPDAVIVIGADNDQWTPPLPDGTRNPGLTAARKAAHAVGGTVVYPVFPDEMLSGNPTDWNDLQLLTDYAEVARQIECRGEPITAKALNGHPIDLPTDLPTDRVNSLDEGGDSDSDNGSFYTPLGHNHGTFYFLTSRGKQIVSIVAGKLTKPNLLQLAPLHYWEREFPRKEGFGGQAVDQAVNALISQCFAKGVFTVNRLRGRGAWFDDGQLVFHAGDRLLIGGEEIALQDHKTRFVYEALPSMKMASTAISNEKAHELHKLCAALSWENRSFGPFLAGWLVIAPVCGALSWRPHIWVTGPSGSGKSWVFQQIVMKVLGDIALAAQGETTAAGIRQALGHDARPVVLDEAEGESHRAAENLQSILALVRASSSDDSGNILKGGQSGEGVSYATKAAFCLSAIVPQMKQTADQNRIVCLTLRESSKTEADRRRFHDQILPVANELLTPEFCMGLRARTLQHLPTLQKNIAVFGAALGEKLGSQRMADQYAPLAAGDYLLHSTKGVTPEEAQAWVAKQSWGEPMDIANTKDELKLVAQIAESVIDVDMEEGPIVRWTVGELVAVVAGTPARVSIRLAALALARKGLKVADEKLWVSNTHIALRAMLRDTPWSQGWWRIIGRVEGAETNKLVRFGAVVSKSAGIPINIVIATADPGG